MMAIVPSTAPAPAVLRLSELTAYLKLSRSTIYQLTADGKLPAPIKLGPRASGWLKTEIDKWLLDRMLARVGT